MALAIVTSSALNLNEYDQTDASLKKEESIDALWEKKEGGAAIVENLGVGKLGSQLNVDFHKSDFKINFHVFGCLIWFFSYSEWNKWYFSK